MSQRDQTMSTTATATSVPTTRAPRAARPAIDRIQGAWESMSEADRCSLLGHSEPLLSGADRIRIARMARAVSAAARVG